MGYFATFFFSFLGIAGFAAAFATLPFWFEHVAVFAMRSLRIYAFPDAIRLAVSLERDTGEWRFAKYEVDHATIGIVHYWDTAAALHVTIKSGGAAMAWKPSWLERRIICDAASRAYRRILRQQLDHVLPH